MAGYVGIRLTAVGRDFLCGEMPVDQRTRQPFGLMHGGASMVLAETLGSVASTLLVGNEPGTRVAGIEISGSHLKAVTSGWVTGRCRALRLGRTLHFWEIQVVDGAGDLACLARHTVSINRARATGTSV